MGILCKNARADVRGRGGSSAFFVRPDCGDGEEENRRARFLRPEECGWGGSSQRLYPDTAAQHTAAALRVPSLGDDVGCDADVMLM